MARGDQIAPEVMPQTGGAPALSPAAPQPQIRNLPSGVVDTAKIIGPAAEKLAQGAFVLGDYFNQAAADDAANQYQEQVGKILYGDPNVKNPDGSPDLGYMGLRGRDALDARQGVEKKIDDLRTKLMGGLAIPSAGLRFDNFSRRYKAITDAQVGSHATAQGKVYATGVNNATAKMAVDQISAGAEDEQSFNDATSELMSARIKNAQLAGLGEVGVKEAMQSAVKEAWEARLNVIAAKDPVRAMSMLEQNKGKLGASYDNLYNRFRPRYEQEVGQQYADRLVGQYLPVEAGADSKAMLRHFEGFQSGAYWDVNHHRVGYGSDTVTRADGRVEKTTPNTIVTREDAERDLERRIQQSQAQLRGAIGADAWNKLDDRTKASLTSVAYNYGRVPDGIAEAARTGDRQKIAESIVALAGHNGGINRGRRMQEASNVLGEKAPMPSQAEAIDQVAKSDLTPQAMSAALAQVNRRFSLLKNQQTAEKAAFNSAVADSTAEAMQTGGTTKPVPLETFTKQLGESAGRVAYQDYQADLEFAAARKNYETMSDVEIQRSIDKMIPAPGTPGYAHRMKQVERLRKYAVDQAKERREDPAAAVSGLQAVKDVERTYDPQRPETFKAVAQARLAAQEQLGIEEEYRSPITKAEALTLMKPVRQMLPGEEQKAIVETYRDFQRLFGDEMAPDAFRYAIKAAKVASEGQQAAATVMQKIAKGLPLTRSDGRAADEAAERAAINKALTGTDYGVYAGSGMPDYNARPPATVEGSPVIPPPVIPPRAITFLLKNPQTAKEFDAQYGTGRAADILKKFPVTKGP